MVRGVERDRAPGDFSTVPQQVEPPVARPLCIRIVAGPDRGREHALRPEALTIGKRADADLVLTDPKVSGHHLAIACVDGRVFLRDLGSRNGSFHAGARFQALEVAAFAAIRIGETELRIEPMGNPGEPPAPAAPFHAAKDQLVEGWEREYLVALLASCDGNIALASRRSGLNRTYLHRLLKKHGISG
jgi:type III secretion system (T3SS) inner membrane Yop/YscD-like protein/regulatory Fis family protein